MNNLIENQFYDYLEKFLEEIKKSFGTDITEIIDEKYMNIREKKYIEEVKENLYCYKENFLGDIKELDKLFNEKEICLLCDINISKLWNNSDNDNKTAIIQYIKVFTFIFESDNKNEKTEETNNFEKLLKDSLLNNDENLKSFYKNMNKDNNNSILNLAQNIAQDLQSETDFNPENLMNLMSNKGQGLNSLISKITNKIDNEIKTGSVNQNDLLNDAQNIMGANGGLFENLFNGMNLNNMNNNMNNNNMKEEENVNIEEICNEKTDISKSEKKTNVKSKKKKKKK